MASDIYMYMISLQRVVHTIENKIMEKVRESKYLERAYVISDHRRGMEIKM